MSDWTTARVVRDRDGDMWGREREGWNLIENTEAWYPSDDLLAEQFGPLVPVNDAVFADNFRSVDPTRDLPAAFFAGRIGQIALIALAGVAGMLIVRSYGLGLAAGGASVPLWLWVASITEIGTNPVGIADRNPGAETTVPHAVTTVGMVATLVLLLIAAGLATYRLTRTRAG